MNLETVTREWLAPPEVRQRERVQAATAAWWRQRDDAAAELRAIADDNRARPVSGYMRDAELCELAQRRADLMADLVFAQGQTDADALRAWLAAVVWHLGWYEFAEGSNLAGMLARVQCAVWWRRRLRRIAVRLREWEGIECGEVCARRQPYVTDDTAERRRQQTARNAAILAATEIEAADGEVITLAQAVEASPAHKPIRRGELMTRIRGCEEWAEACGMVGLFTTNTCPSRFHPQRFGGGVNPSWDGSHPRDGQAWLRNTWARCRAALHRLGVGVFGFRVAEPHHDGCPHWHMLLWCKPQDAQTLRDTMRRYWLADAGEEPGAAEHRFKCKDMEKGGATGYVAKYIAKNIDDEGSVGEEGHRDEWANPQGDAFGGKAQRVEAWAAAHGIRQFQAIGQPPVTVWRELRRVDEQASKGASDTVREAIDATNKEGAAKRACWFAYMRAQGGPMVGRDYRVRLLTREEEREGRYGVTTGQRPIGVYDAKRPGEWVLSSRREWKPRGTWREDQRRPVALLGTEFRTAKPADLGPVSLTVRGRLDGTRRGPLRTWLQALKESEPGAVHHEETTCVPPPTSPPRPASTSTPATRRLFRSIWSSSPS